MAEKSGPGWILLNFNPDPYDQTLFVATYDFNAAENVHLNSSQAHWAAILANVHQAEALQTLFPEGKSYWLSEGLTRSDGGFLLEVTPVNGETLETLTRWVKADQSLMDLTDEILERGVDPHQEKMLQTLQAAYPFFQGDPFLESSYWRIAALHEAAGGRLPQAVEDEQRAIDRGYPLADFYNELGGLYVREGDMVSAEQSYKKALGLVPNHTNAGMNLGLVSIWAHRPQGPVKPGAR
jgi:tetratricopeptide (TPR) repeat protein